MYLYYEIELDGFKSISVANIKSEAVQDTVSFGFCSLDFSSCSFGQINVWVGLFLHVP